MKFRDHLIRARRVLFVVLVLALSIAGADRLFPTSAQTGARTSHINDFAGVVNDATRAKLSTVLENVKAKTGIDFAIVTVTSTDGRDISDFLRRLAREWNVGARDSSKSLLMVVSVNDKDSLAQFSRSAQLVLPEGVLADMHERMRQFINSGDFNEGLDVGVRTFVNTIASHMSLNAADFETASEAVASADSPKPEPVASNTPIAVESPTPDVSRATRPRTRTVLATTTVREAPVPTKVSANDTGTDDAAEAEEVELTLTRPLDDRIAKLNTFLNDHPASKARGRATELLVSAHAALGDQKLKAGDNASGVEELMTAISLAPVDSSDKLFSGVVSQIPLNLYFRSERAAALKAAQEIETKFANDPKRLLGVAGFYISTEQGAEAARVAKRAITLAPDLADAHQALGLAQHISLQLDDAVAEYKRALELDPNSKAARRALADLQRAFGRPEEAAALYRKHLEIDPADKSARAGLVLALLDLGRTDEAKTEFDSALAADPRNLSLLAGAAYWYAAHNEPDKALDLGNRAFELEPRYTWLHVAVARALMAKQKPMEAERAIRFAMQYGRFATLDYELANTLIGEGLYGEAAEVLERTFSIKDGVIATKLAGHVPVTATTFEELLAPERRASIFQAVSADSAANANLIKNLLVFNSVLKTDSGRIDEKAAVAAARKFAAGDDAARVHRQLYAASRLLENGLGDDAALELAEAARASADVGLTVPALTVAVQADEYRDIRANAIAQGGTPNIPEAPRNVLANLLRGRIEDLSGWARLNQDQLDEAVVHLERAVNILPTGTPSWRTSLWRLGSALERQDKKDVALANYIRSYNAGPPDAARRSVIERVYRSIHGSLNGLEELLGTTAIASADAGASAQPSPVGEKAEPATTPAPQPEPTTTPTITAPEPIVTPTPEPAVEKPVSDASPAPTPEPTATPASPPTSPSLAESPVETINKPRATVVTIKGRVLDATNVPVANVVVVLISPQGSVLASTTDVDGNYQFSVAPSLHSYRVIPSKDGFRFEPVDKIVEKADEDQQELNFLAVSVRQ